MRVDSIDVRAKFLGGSPFVVRAGYSDQSREGKEVGKGCIVLILAADAAATSSISDTLMGGLLALGGVVVSALIGLLTTLISGRKDFDQRLRLEKEFVLYCDIWEKLFHFRQAITELVDPISLAPPDEEETVYARTSESFNTLQSAVKHAEPFIHRSVLTPAREILTAAREIFSYERQIRRIDKQREQAARQRGSMEQDMEKADKQNEFDDQNQNSLMLIAELADKIAVAIRKRVGPP